MEMTTPLLVGSYVDAHFSGTLDVFKAQNPDLFKKKCGGLKSDYVKAGEIIIRLERDPYFMKAMSGEKQVIFTGELFGVEWKIMVDSYGKDSFLTDLKVMASLAKSCYARDFGHMSFVPYWGYDLQAAIYQKIVEISTGKKLPFFIAGASKEKVTDIAVIYFDQGSLDDVLSTVEPSIKRIVQIKNGEVEPDKCGICDYCKFNRILTKPIHYSELTLSI